MSIRDAIILGIIQGITEWLPVSSSGHLVIAQELMGLNVPIFFDVMVHLGTLVVVIWIFRRDVWDILVGFLQMIILLTKGVPFHEAIEAPERKLAMLVIVGTIPTAMVGYLFKDPLESLFSNLLAVGMALLFTGTYLFFTRKIRTEKPRKIGRMEIKDALIIGTMQGVAIIPGVSRSGSTIATGLFAGLDKELATRYSFLLFIPAILGATILQAEPVISGKESIQLIPTLAGTFTAMIVGYFAIQSLLKVIKERKLHLFSYYCWAVGAAVIGFYLFF